MAQHGHYLVTGEELANWQKLSLQVPVEENGYIYIYVANESTADVDVYFDDMEVQLLDAPVTNASDYYPFGLARKTAATAANRTASATRGSLQKRMKKRGGMRLSSGCMIVGLEDGFSTDSQQGNLLRLMREWGIILLLGWIQMEVIKQNLVPRGGMVWFGGACEYYPNRVMPGNEGYKTEKWAMI